MSETIFQSINSSLYYQDYQDNITHHGFAERELLEAFELQFTCYSIVIPIISCIGLFGNILTFLTLRKRQPVVASLSLLLYGLVVTDTAIIVLSLITMTFFSLSMTFETLSFFVDYVYPKIFLVCNFLIMAFQQSNVLITVAVAVERYVAMCHPFQSLYLRTRRNARFILIGIILFSIAFNTPRLFASYSQPKFGSDLNITHYSVEATTFGKTHFYMTVYVVWLYSVFVYIIPIILLLYCSVPTIRCLIKLQRRRRYINVEQSTDVSTTICIIIVVLCFLVCQTPGIFAQINFGESISIKVFSVSNTLFVFNSSVNFFIYTAAIAKFRNTLTKKIFKTKNTTASPSTNLESRGEGQTEYSKREMMHLCETRISLS